MTKFITVDRQTLAKKEFNLLHKAMLATLTIQSAYVIRRIGTFSEIIYRKGGNNAQ